MIFLPSLEADPPVTCHNEMGEPCPWPYDPLFLAGAPLGQYHCPYYGAMILAGGPHIDYTCRTEADHQRDERGVCGFCGDGLVTP